MEVESVRIVFLAKGRFLIGVLLYLVFILWELVKFVEWGFFFIHGDLMEIEVVAVLWLLYVDIELTWFVGRKLGIYDSS